MATRNGLIGDHSPNWAGIARHDMGVLNKTNDPNPESIKSPAAPDRAPTRSRITT